MEPFFLWGKHGRKQWLSEDKAHLFCTLAWKIPEQPKLTLLNVQKYVCSIWTKSKTKRKKVLQGFTVHCTCHTNFTVSQLQKKRSWHKEIHAKRGLKAPRGSNTKIEILEILKEWEDVPSDIISLVIFFMCDPRAEVCLTKHYSHHPFPCGHCAETFLNSVIMLWLASMDVSTHRKSLRSSAGSSTVVWNDWEAPIHLSVSM